MPCELKARRDRAGTARWIALLAFVAIFSPEALSQEAPAQAAAAPLGVTGAVGMNYEFNSISGRPARRSGFYGEVFSQLSLDFYGIETELDLVLSTDESRSRQSAKEFGLQGQWGWGEGGLGHLTLDWAPYGFSGITLLGGYVSVAPKGFLLSFAGGRSQRATPGRFSTIGSAGLPVPGALGGATYERWVWSGRLGYGDKERSHVHVVGVYGQDRSSSLDLGPVGGVRPVAVRPAQNLALSPSLGLSLPAGEGRVSAFADGTVSLYTRDTGADKVDLDLGPLTDLFPIRRSTGASFATDARIEGAWPTWGLKAQYERIQPGFSTMGVPYIRDDHQAFVFQPRAQFLERRLGVEGGLRLQKNNLSGTRSSTQRRTEADLRVRYRPVPTFNIAGSIRGQFTSSDPTASSPNSILLERRTNVLVFQLTPTYTRRAGSNTHTFAMAGNFQVLSDDSRAVTQGLRPGIGSTNSALTGTYSIGMASGLQLNVASNLQATQSDMLDLLTLGGTAGGSLPITVRDKKARINATTSLTRTNRTTTFGGTVDEFGFTVLSATLGSRIQLSDVDNLQLKVRTTRTVGGPAPFTEAQLLVEYEWRF